MRGEEKPYDMQAPCNDIELAKAIENDREMEELSTSSLFTCPPIFELPTLKTTIPASATPVSATTASVPTTNDISSIMATTSKALNVTLPDSPIAPFPSICSLLNGEDIDVKDPGQIHEPNGINKPLQIKSNFLGKSIPQTISLPTTPLPLTTTTTISLPTQPVNLYNAKIPTSSPKVFSPLPNQPPTPLFFAVDVNGDQQRCIQRTTREISRNYAPFQSNGLSVVSNNHLGCSISIGSVDSSTMSLSPCPSSTGSASSPHSSSNQGINGPTTSPDLGLSSVSSISPEALHLTSSMISTHLPHSLDSLLTPAASPEDDSLEPWIQTV